jgi:glycosyltransferase involved in cell wall biosynthesis
MMIEKGPLVLLQALTMLQSRSIPFSATFAGPWYRDSCRDQFNTLVAQEGLQQSVRYLGPQFGHAKESLFAEADIFAFPTYYSAESFPLVILEAMSSGLPVLSTPEGAITEIVVDGVTGLLAPQRDPDQLAANLEHLIMNPLERVRMGRNGRQRYLDNYTIARFHERVVQQLDTAWRLHRHNHRPSKAP